MVTRTLFSSPSFAPVPPGTNLLVVCAPSDHPEDVWHKLVPVIGYQAYLVDVYHANGERHAGPTHAEMLAGGWEYGERHMAVAPVVLVGGCPTVATVYHHPGIVTDVVPGTLSLDEIAEKVETWTKLMLDQLPDADRPVVSEPSAN